MREGSHSFKKWFELEYGRLPTTRRKFGRLIMRRLHDVQKEKESKSLMMAESQIRSEYRAALRAWNALNKDALVRRASKRAPKRKVTDAG